jgi:2Fe-2S ferredoxin
MPNNLKITFILPDRTEKELGAPIGHSIMEIAKSNDIEQIEALCGGSKACATCHIILSQDLYEQLEKSVEKRKTEEEEDMLDLAFDVQPTSRLGCQVFMSADMNKTIINIPKGGSE